MNENSPRFTIRTVFKTAADQNASDIYLSPHSMPLLRVKDQFKKIALMGDITPMSADECNQLILSSMNEFQQNEFRRELDFDYSLDLEGIGRFRINVFQASGAYEMVARYVAGSPKPLASLGLPGVLSEICRLKTGLVLVTGATGSGKTNTLAGMIDAINESSEKRIITIEDPVEIIHSNKRSLISQRELFFDTKDFKSALRGAMRQRPDVILIGEMRDAETVNTALNAAESGHLVFSTLHSINAQETIARILDFYPADEQQQVRNLLSTMLRAVISQRLITDKDGPEGKIYPLVEILREDLRIADAIRDPDKTHGIIDIMNESSHSKMQTFDGHLEQMVEEEIITAERAKKYSENPNELARRLKQKAFF